MNTNLYILFHKTRLGVTIPKYLLHILFPLIQGNHHVMNFCQGLNMDLNLKVAATEINTATGALLRMIQDLKLNAELGRIISNNNDGNE